MSKKLFIETFGCHMNVRDSEHMIAELSEKEGYELTQNPKEADLILINTCSVREKPVHKLFSEIGHYNKLKKKEAKVGVCGCTASHMGQDIIKQAPSVDFVLGARNISKITSVIHRPKAVEIDMNYDDTSYLFSDYRSNPYKAFINISVGCDKTCAYCIVPSTRGEEISIPQELIIKEAQKAVDHGAKEVILLGQNVNSWGKRFSTTSDKSNFVTLLQAVSKIDGLERIRFTSPHPLHCDDEFMDEFINNPKICKSLHLPLQSGSTAILKAMRRGYTSEWFLNRVEKLRAALPQVTISTDIIVAFPGETEEDFLETLRVVKEAQFDFSYSFKFSPRPGTLAEHMENTIIPDIADNRLYQLQALLDEIHQKSCHKQHHHIHDVLFEECKDGYLFGKTNNGFGVKVQGDSSHVGHIRPVTITGGGKFVLVGSIDE